jgi:hypothetical protein
MAAPEPGSVVDSTTLKPFDWSNVDIDAVRSSALAHKAECETRIAHTDAVIRAECRPPRLREQETLARLADNIGAVEELLAVIDSDGCAMA